MISALPAYLFAVMVTLAAGGDALSYRIPNWLNLLIAVLFLPTALLAGMPIDVMGLHLACGASMLLAGFILHLLHLIGGGDAKLLAAGALWLGWPALPAFLVWTAMAGGLLGLVVGLRVLYLKHVRKSPVSTDIPYGIALAAGGLIAMPQSGWMLA